MVPPRPALLPPAERPGLTGRAISEDGGSLRQRWRPHDPLDSLLPLDHEDLVVLLSTVTLEAEPSEERGAPEPPSGLKQRLILRRSGLLGAAESDEAGRVRLRCRVVDAAGPGPERLIPAATAAIAVGLVRRRRTSSTSSAEVPAARTTSASEASGTSSGATVPTNVIPSRSAASPAPRAALRPNGPRPAATSTRAPGRDSAKASSTGPRYRLAGEGTDTTPRSRSTSSALPPWFQRTRPRPAAHRAASSTRSLP